VTDAAKRAAGEQRARACGRAFAAVVVALVGLHLWPPFGGPEPILLGVLPWDLAVSLAWMAIAGLCVVWMTTPTMWPDDEDDR